MTVQRITIDLPDAVFRALVRLAEATDQPVKLIVTQSVLSNLPPSIDNAAPELQAELLRMQALSNEEILAVASPSRRHRSNSSCS